MQMNFDPMTGQPINQSANNINNNEIPNQIQPEPVTINTQQQIQNIPTVEQSKQTFINNTQENNNVKKEENKEGPNIAFILILFAIILAAIFFLFPYLLNILG